MVNSLLNSQRIFFVLVCLLMVTSGLLLHWLYLVVIESEKIRLMDLVLSHVRLLETLSKVVEEGASGVGDQMTKMDRMKKIFDAQAEYHRFGKTGEIIFIGTEDISVRLEFSAQSETKLLSDKSGREILAVYSSITGTSHGVAATLDLQEI